MSYIIIILYIVATIGIGNEVKAFVGCDLILADSFNECNWDHLNCLGLYYSIRPHLGVFSSMNGDVTVSVTRWLEAILTGAPL